MRRTGVYQLQNVLADADLGADAECQLRRDDARFRVDPWCEGLAALLQARAGVFIVEIVFIRVAEALLLGDDHRVGLIAEGLQAVDMICVIMADDHVTDWLVRHRADLAQKRVAKRRRAEGIEHDNALVGD